MNHPIPPPPRPTAAEPVPPPTSNGDGAAMPAPGDVGRPSYPEPLLHVHGLDDPVVAQLGFDPRSPYVERFWVSILGPSAVLLLRRLAAGLEADPDGFDLDPLCWAQELGLGTRSGKHSPLWRTIDRLCRFGLAHRHGPHLSVHRHLPPLTLRQVQRLPPHLQAAHQTWQNGHDSRRAA